MRGAHVAAGADMVAPSDMMDGRVAAIRTALDNAKYFILMASPAAAHSRWVKKELEHWLATRGAGSIIIVLTEGSLEWNPTTNVFDASATTALPSSSLAAFGKEQNHYRQQLLCYI